MKTSSPFATALKALFQLGPAPLILFALYRLGLATGYYRWIERRWPGTAQQVSQLRPLFTLPSRPDLVRILGDRGKVGLLREADEIVKGNVRLFGGGAVPLHVAFKVPLHHWTAYETGRAALPNYPSPKSLVADLKFLWEPARFGWAFTLGRAYHLTGKDKYALCFWKTFEKFDTGNPPYLGPHWMNAQEVAIRLLALVWCAQVFAAAASSTSGRTARLAKSVAQHAARIPPTLLYARSQNNNHLITESTALYTAGVALDHAEWRDLGWRWLNRGLRSQISSYGEYIQHSTNYHRLMLQCALWADAILRPRKEIWPAITRQALTRASHWLFSMLDPASGRTPNLGANDGALILPLSSASFGDFRPTVQAAARAFLRTGLAPGEWDDLALWLGLPAAIHTADSAAYAGEHLIGRRSWAYLRVSSFKSRLSHMDQLHFDLWWRGFNVTQDAGTYLYNAPPPWDNPLVASRVHNTVTIDGREQMTRGGRFLTLDWFPAYSKNVLEGDERVLGRMLGYHRGYRRLGVLHERLASAFDDGHWEVEDDLTFTRRGAHRLRLHWLLPDWDWKIRGDAGPVEIRLKSPQGWITLRLRSDPLISDLAASVSLVRAGQLLQGSREVRPFEGWVSPTYGVKLPALSLALTVESSSSVSFRTEFVFPRSGARRS